MMSTRRGSWRQGSSVCSPLLNLMKQMVGLLEPSGHLVSGQIVGGRPSQTLSARSVGGLLTGCSVTGERSTSPGVPAAAREFAIEVAGAVTAIIATTAATEVRENVMAGGEVAAGQRGEP